ncbi:MAG: segregation and condensation protein A [Myxococcota bacterium]|jgi:segregation and condensation protein A
MSVSETQDPTEPEAAEDVIAVASAAQIAPVGYGVKLPVFEGPLDLLLHLIRQNEVDITDIPIAQIAAQYLQYLEVMQTLDLDVAAEYLVMSATLAHIKSRMLLPPSEEEGVEDEFDPRAELVARLLEYQRYKEVADALSKRRWLGRDVYDAHGAGIEKVPDAEREIEVGLFELLEAFRLLLNSDKEEEGEITNIHVVETEEITVRDQMMFVMKTISSHESIDFLQLFPTDGTSMPSRTIVIATFLAILELTRLEALAIYQAVNDYGSPEGGIRLRPTLGVNEISWDDRITELM